MGNAFYAHSRPDTPQGQWQPLDKHLREVAHKAAEFAAAFASADWAHNAGWLHDLGKADNSFQAYLLRENDLDDSEYDVPGAGRINHSSAGAALAQVPCFFRKMRAYHLKVSLPIHAVGEWRAGGPIPRRLPLVLWNLNTAIHCIRPLEDDPKLDEAK